MRTHTLHDPVTYRTREVGDYVLSGKLPTPRVYSRRNAKEATMPEIRIINDPPSCSLPRRCFARRCSASRGRHAGGGVGRTLRGAGAHLYRCVRGPISGHSNSFPGELTLPGGQRVPHAAVTHVGVLPTSAVAACCGRYSANSWPIFTSRG
ncbi:Uncharacterised protein [Raoultella terrigena]|uniref:Uncharacterized protein n=1 Tax=Raoultella terrigena TaxID=577 RepID=A0A3P8IRQ1_RAOTE|nr:Uncharacterised protein [Raoultella terrigena]